MPSLRPSLLLIHLGRTHNNTHTKATNKHNNKQHLDEQRARLVVGLAEVALRQVRPQRAVVEAELLIR